MIRRNNDSHKLNIKGFNFEPHSKHSYFTLFFFSKTTLHWRAWDLEFLCSRDLVAVFYSSLKVDLVVRNSHLFPLIIFIFYPWVLFEVHKIVYFHGFNVDFVCFWDVSSMDCVELLCEWEKTSILDLKSSFSSFLLLKASSLSLDK